MPAINVRIEWDQPDEQQWLNPDNVNLALSTYCRNTRFAVSAIPDIKRQCELQSCGHPVCAATLNLSYMGNSVAASGMYCAWCADLDRIQRDTRLSVGKYDEWLADLLLRYNQATKEIDRLRAELIVDDSHKTD